MGENNETKTFGLKPIEQQMLQVFEGQYFTTLSNFLSFVAMERLAYNVTESTKFEVQGDKLIIREALPEAKEVITDPSTADAIKADK